MKFWLLKSKKLIDFITKVIYYLNTNNKGIYMDKLETVIFQSLEKFKNSQLSLYAKVTRQYLAQEIAKDIKSLADKERQEKECN